MSVDITRAPRSSPEQLSFVSVELEQFEIYRRCVGKHPRFQTCACLCFAK